MGVTNLGRVQGGGFYYADYTPTDADSSIRLGRELLKPNTVKALIGDHVVMANGSLWEITEFSEGELGVVLVLSRKTSIIGPQGEPGIGCSVNGEPTALDFTSDPQSQINDLKQPRIERISVWKRKTIEEGKVLSVNSKQFNMETASYWQNRLLFELRMCCFSSGGLNEPTTTYFVSRPGSGNTERIPCTCGPNAQELGVFSPTIYSNAIIIYNYTPYPIYLDEVIIWIQK